MNSFLFFLSFILLNPWVLRFLSQTLIPGKVGGSDFFIFSPVFHFFRSLQSHSIFYEKKDKLQFLKFTFSVSFSISFQICGKFEKR